MLDDGVRSSGADLEVVDVATLLVQAVERGGKGAAADAPAAEPEPPAAEPPPTPPA